MGLILDTSIPVRAERQRKSVRQLLESITVRYGDEEIAISTVTVVELTHGIARAKTEQQRFLRRRFLEDLYANVFDQPLTTPIAELAGRIDGEQTAKGNTIAFEDLIIGGNRPSPRLRRPHPQRPTFPDDSRPASRHALSSDGLRDQNSRRV